MGTPYLLRTPEKDDALRWTLIQDSVTDLNHQFPNDITSGPGGLRHIVCGICGRTIYVNSLGVTFGSAMREMCQTLLTDEREEL